MYSTLAMLNVLNDAKVHTVFQIKMEQKYFLMHPRDTETVHFDSLLLSLTQPHTGGSPGNIIYKKKTKRDKVISASLFHRKNFSNSTKEMQKGNVFCLSNTTVPVVFVNLPMDRSFKKSMPLSC